MTEQHQPERDILGGLARAVIGGGMLALAAREAIAAGARRRPIDGRPASQSLADIIRNRPKPRRKPPEAGLPVPAIPPGGPLPKQGGAAAPLEFDR
jgi:hypothetical protein